MSSNTTLLKIINGVIGTYVPKSINGKEIFIGTVVTLPPGDPSKGDTWAIGFDVTVEDCDDQNGNLLCFDGQDWHCVEPDRVAVGEITPAEFVSLLTQREIRIASEEAAELAELMKKPDPVVKAEEDEGGESWADEEEPADLATV